MKKNFILVVGYPRSGTYYLSSYLSKKFKITFPIENKIILEFKRYKFLWGDLKENKNVINLLNCMLIYIKIWVVYGIKPKNVKDHLNYSIAISIPKLIYKIKKKKIAINDFKDIIFLLYKDFAKKNKNIYYGEKEANFYFKPLNQYQDTLKDIKIIYLIRDSRYLFSSIKKVWFGTKNPYLFSKLWNRHVEDLKKFNHKKKILLIRYEDLATKPNIVNHKIEKFLKIKATNNKRKQILAKTISQLNTHKKLSKKNFDNNNILDITNKELNVIERLTNKNLKFFKYKVLNLKMTIKDQILYHLSCDQTKNSIARIIFFLLPLFLRILFFFKINTKLIQKIFKLP